MPQWEPNEKPRRWRRGKLRFTELYRFDYGNCFIATGEVKGHPVDTQYLHFRKEEDEQDTLLLMRPDEMAVTAHLTSGMLLQREFTRLEQRQRAAARRKRRRPGGGRK